MRLPSFDPQDEEPEVEPREQDPTQDDPTPVRWDGPSTFAGGAEWGGFRE